MWLSFLLLLLPPLGSLCGDMPDLSFNHLASYLVSLRSYDYVEHPGDNHFCSGAIISERHVLTSGHCITNKRGLLMNARRIKLAFCSPLADARDKREQLVRIHSMVVYPLYERNKQDDLGVIKLRRNIWFRGHHLVSVSIGSDQLDVGKDCFGIGWTQRESRRKMKAHPLLVANVEIRPFEECLKPQAQNLSRNAHAEGDFLMCLNNTDPQICMSDIGGPIFCNNRLYGLALGFVDCSDHDPVFFSYVPYYNSWLERIISQGVLLHHRLPLRWFVAWALLLLLRHNFLSGQMHG
ncbi:factor V activator RVV-V alpha [Drosophila miranda]|uniref:factor V activator RVV-V alpha n=1 Tax=Drosophila miranda TaxID=7229 RepID=UPI0007E6CFB5|nr:factor V activator RVV-V alpha [Drosophila miranda]